MEELFNVNQLNISLPVRVNRFLPLYKCLLVLTSYAALLWINFVSNFTIIVENGCLSMIVLEYLYLGVLEETLNPVLP